jgi:endoglucanase
LPALSYIDHKCSYASNEIAINWQAPFSYLINAVEILRIGNYEELIK